MHTDTQTAQREEYERAQCSVTLQYTAKHNQTLQYTAKHNQTLQYTAKHNQTLQYTAIHCNRKNTRGAQCSAVFCSVLQCLVVFCSVLQCFPVRCSALQCVAVCCSVIRQQTHPPPHARSAARQQRPQRHPSCSSRSDLKSPPSPPREREKERKRGNIILKSQIHIYFSDTYCPQYLYERWGAGVETHFQEI